MGESAEQLGGEAEQPEDAFEPPVPFPSAAAWLAEPLEEAAARADVVLRAEARQLAMACSLPRPGAP